MREKRTIINLSMKDAQVEMLDRIIKSSEIADLPTSRNLQVLYIISQYENLKKELTDLKADHKSVILTALTPKSAAAPKPEKLSHMEKKRLEEQAERDRALEFAKQLEGRVEGDICYFTKYDMYPTGRVVASKMSENIFNLSEKFVASQYYPSKEEWLAKKKAQDEREAAHDAAQKAKN